MSMLEHVSERIYVAPGGVNIDIILADDDRAILIDTGGTTPPRGKCCAAWPKWAEG
ncbi:MAG: hypothetical protein R3A46_11470 [Thermomicrobiales bacterium]